MKKVLITGIAGRDGSCLAEPLLSESCEAHGLIRRASTFNTDRIDHLYRDIHDPGAKILLYYEDLSVSGQLTDLLHGMEPEEIYQLGARSHVRPSLAMPKYTGDVTGLGTTRPLGAIRKTGIKAKFYHVSSSRMFAAPSSSAKRDYAIPTPELIADPAKHKEQGRNLEHAVTT